MKLNFALFFYFLGPDVSLIVIYVLLSLMSMSSSLLSTIYGNDPLSITTK